MITINYQTFGTSGFNLRLRLYQEGETKYINVTKLLRGPLKKKHWSQKKQYFVSSAPFSAENNAIIQQFKQRYVQIAMDWNGSINGLIAFVGSGNFEQSGDDAVTVTDYIKAVVERLNSSKHEDGSGKGSFENYLKLDKRLQEFCILCDIDYPHLLLTDLNAQFINNVFKWVETKRQGKGMCYVSKMLHSIIMKADKDGLLDADEFSKCNWYVMPRGSAHKYKTLTEEQCRLFALMDPDDVSKSCHTRLYKDFCLFILYTGQSACDAIALKYSDIKNINGVPHFVFCRRKIAEKQVVPCSVPINKELQAIMDRWKWKSKDGYIFPIRNKHKLRTQTTNNGDIKHFIGNLNNWLKGVGKFLECDFPLHTYTFRHTAITRYISKGVPIIYIANMMGTSVENCEKIYYNNQADIASRNKVLSAMNL